MRKLGLGLIAFTLLACNDNAATTAGLSATASGTTSAGDGDGGDDGADTGPRLDVGDGGGLGGCSGDGPCELIDVLFVVDNSGTMGEEQLNLAANFLLLIDQLQTLTDSGGGQINANVNLMVTTSDLGHPLCTSFQHEGYAPARGAPIFSGCNARIGAFTGVDPFNPLEVPEACTENCPMDVAPGGDPFIHFDAEGTNVPYNDVAGALSCMAPQGINGCGYEAPLETMLQALRPEACWNNPDEPGCENDEQWSWVNRGFLRPGATLAIAIITDEADCSVVAPDGYAWFTDEDKKKYWKKNPEWGGKAPSSAVCWRAGVYCEDADDDGVYESCQERYNEVLHPTDRYVEFLDYLEKTQEMQIVMLGVLGVPPVTEHSDKPPYEPTKGGVHDLVYRDWRDGEYTGEKNGGDILPAEWARGMTAGRKQWEFGIGPGCTGQNDAGDFTGQAVPPLRIREVCESRNFTDETGKERVRCCIESICDEDFSDAMKCLTDIIADTLDPVE